MKNNNYVDIVLLSVPILWSMTFPFIHVSVQTVSPTAFVFWRFVVAALILLPITIKRFKHINRYMIGWAAVLGLLNCGAFLFQTIGLQTVASARAAFITGSCVVLVPILSFLLRLGKPSFIDICSSLVCLIGLYILTGANISNIVVGDLWIILCAIATALTIILVQKISANIQDVFAFTFLQIIFTIPFTLIHANGLLNVSFIQDPFIISSILFCAVFATAIALIIQVHYQKYTTEFKAALIFSTEPIFATIFAYLFFHEMVNLNIIIGGALIALSILLSEYFSSRSTEAEFAG